ncbi:MAG TPA: hypothetical protein VE616_21045 [Candidatus Udaeobacter sp.]|nr:hypothetical protein [Candidatus Udaeobacter sp.]
MKNALRVLIVALTTLAFSSIGFAQEKKTTPATPAAPATEKKTEKSEKPKTSRVTGEVTSVDAKAGSLNVKAKDKDLKLTAESSSAKGALEKVKVGDMVKVSYTEKDGKMVASSVDKTKAKAEEKKSDTMEKKTEKK